MRPDHGAMEIGADLMIANRFGKRERDGKRLSLAIEQAVISSSGDTQPV